MGSYNGNSERLCTQVMHIVFPFFIFLSLFFIIFIYFHFIFYLYVRIVDRLFQVNTNKPEFVQITATSIRVAERDDELRGKKRDSRLKWEGSNWIETKFTPTTKLALKSFKHLFTFRSLFSIKKNVIFTFLGNFWGIEDCWNLSVRKFWKCYHWYMITDMLNLK